MEALYGQRDHPSTESSMPHEDDPTTIHLWVVPSGRYAYGGVGPGTSSSGWGYSTFNRASIEGLAETLMMTEADPVTVYTNSYYLADALAHRRPLQWARQHWRYRTGELRANHDLWSEPDLLAATFRVSAAYHEPDHLSSEEMARAYELAMTAVRAEEALR